jgi:hypothetical protein
MIHRDSRFIPEGPVGEDETTTEIHIITPHRLAANVSKVIPETNSASQIQAHTKVRGEWHRVTELDLASFEPGNVVDGHTWEWGVRCVADPSRHLRGPGGVHCTCNCDTPIGDQFRQISVIPSIMETNIVIQKDQIFSTSFLECAVPGVDRPLPGFTD